VNFCTQPRVSTPRKSNADQRVVMTKKSAVMGANAAEMATSVTNDEIWILVLRLSLSENRRPLFRGKR